MKYLLDTCTFLWVLNDSEELTENAKEIIENPNTDLYLSSVSQWEIIIKNKRGKLPLPDGLIKNLSKVRTRLDINECPLLERHALMQAKLPDFHQDPFDRMLVCQALCESFTILTPDSEITKYPVQVEW